MAELSLQGLARELTAQAALAQVLARPVVEQATGKALEGWQESYRGIRSKPRIWSALGKSVWSHGGAIIGEAGINKNRRGRGGSMAHILEFGSVNNSARNDGGVALMKAAPGFLAGMQELAHSLFRTGSGQALSPSMSTANPARFNAPLVSDVSGGAS